MASRIRAPRRRSASEFVFFFLLLLLFIYIIYPSGQSSGDRGRKGTDFRSVRPDNPLPCYHIPGAEDVVVVFRTSAAELENKLPIHFNTTLQCFPNYLIFSDYKENYKGYHILDALDSTNRRIREKNADFELWRRLRRGGPDALDDDEIWHPDDTVKDLDKWKWLPMLDRTFQEYPDKKWYVFIETDTFIFWRNLVKWLSELDHHEPHYIGSYDRSAAMMHLIHGEAGVIFSYAAMKSMLDLIRPDQSSWEERTSHHPDGPSILAEAVVHAEIGLTEAWPILQNAKLNSLDYTRAERGKHLWCYPTVSYANMAPQDISEMWEFEQSWFRDHPGNDLYHKDVFKQYILPRLAVRSGRVDDWNNFGDEEGPLAEDVSECQHLCVKKSTCVQFALVYGRCQFSSVPKMGEWKRDAESRWLLARAQTFADKMDPCHGEEGWISD